MEFESRRGRRRRLTERVARRRAELHDRHCDARWLAGRRVKWGFRCWCEGKGLWFWDTYRPLGCPCSSRKKGRPRVNNGMCSFGRRDRVYRWRAQVRDLNHLLARGHSPEGDSVAVLSDARSVEKTGLWQD